MIPRRGLKETIGKLELLMMRQTKNLKWE